MAGADDLSDLFLPAPPGPAQPMYYRQGIVVSWNPTTLQNKINVAGTIIEDVPVLGVAESASLVPGAVVGLMVVGSTWAIIGRLVTPNTPAALDAITQVSQGIVSASVAGSDFTISTSYTDLGSTFGPEVSVNIRASGRALVLCTAMCIIQPASTTIVSSIMSYNISGSTTRAAIPGTTPSAILQAKLSGPSMEVDGRFTAVALEEGLNPGLTTFTAKYRSGNGETARFSGRNLTVFAL